MNERYGIAAEINLVPLIDVSLTLLMVFMIMTPFLIRAQIKTNIPDAASGTEITDDARTVTVQISKEGQVFVEGNAVSADGLKEELGRRIATPATWTVIVEADRDCALDPVVQAMDAAKQLGVSKMGIAVRKDKRQRR